MTNEVGRNILLVEDDHAVRKLITGILAGKSYHVLAAGTGEEAVAMADAFAGEIHLLITDFSLGEMNGLELAVRVAGSRPSLAILLISGYTEIPLPEALKEAVRAEYLAKPFTMEALLSKVGEMTAGGRGRVK